MKTGNDKKVIIRFIGDKAGLHKQLKAWCVETETSINQTVVGLIEKHLKKSLKKNI
jgi:hypothetical protein